MTPEIKELLFEIATEDAEALHSEYGAKGLWVSKDQLPSDQAEFEEQEYENVVSAERLAEIQSGQLLTEGELLALREQRLCSSRRLSRSANRNRKS